MAARPGLVLFLATVAAGAAAAGGDGGTWRWTRSEAEFNVRVGGNASLTATCKGLGKPSRRGGAAAYSRLRCRLGFPDGDVYSIVITPTGPTTYHLVSSHRVHRAHGNDGEQSTGKKHGRAKG
jgi:hypothetical protein